MTSLTQQLEDKKKGCGKKFDTEVGNTFDEYYICQERGLCPICQEIITILEQAIAEIKNIKSQQQNDRKIDLGETSSVEGLQPLVSQNHISADISNLLQKQRQEILNIFDEWFFNDSDDLKDYKGWDRADFEQQLNQPKTEQ